MTITSSKKDILANDNTRLIIQTSIFKNNPENVGICYVKKPQEKSHSVNFLKKIFNGIQERKELRTTIKNWLTEQGVPISKEIRATLPNTFQKGNSADLRAELKKNMASKSYIQTQFLSMITTHLDENLDTLKNAPNIFDLDANLSEEISKFLQEEMSKTAGDLAEKVVATAKSARTEFFVDKTNSDYGSMSILENTADKISFRAAIETLTSEIFHLPCGEKFSDLCKMLDTSLDSAIKSPTVTVDTWDTDKLKNKIVTDALLSFFTKSLFNELKARSKSI
jgi:hypothetical protein